MKKVILDEHQNSIRLNDTTAARPIFAKMDGEFKGMLIHEDNKGWILRIGGNGGATGWHSTRRECIKSCLKLNYEFFVE